MESDCSKNAGARRIIDRKHVENWNKVAPWPDYVQVEQDLIISRMLVDIFSDEFLRDELRFRGGTALNKLHFPAPLRYSEDIDLVRTTQGPIGKILHHLCAKTESWIGRPKVVKKYFLVKLVFRFVSNDPNISQISLKLEINTRERAQFVPPVALPFSIQNSWFSGQTSVPTFSIEEMLATKLRALLQRDKGRDLYDLDHALNVFEDLNTDRIIDLFQKYLDRAELSISRAEAQARRSQRFNETPLLQDIHSLLPVEKSKELTRSNIERSFWNVFENLVCKIPGQDWSELDDFVKHKRSMS